MSDHRSVRLGSGGRRRIVEAVEAGMTQKRAAARFCVSPATVNRWVVRARQARPARARERSPCPVPVLPGPALTHGVNS